MQIVTLRIFLVLSLLLGLGSVGSVWAETSNETISDNVKSSTQTPPWQDALFTEDPRVNMVGSPELWNQIEIGNIEEGMTKNQVNLSWGKPLRVEANDSVWIYGIKKLNFDSEVLHSIEILPKDLPKDLVPSEVQHHGHCI